MGPIGKNSWVVVSKQHICCKTVSLVLVVTANRTVNISGSSLTCGKAIKVQSTVKFFGVIFDQHMSWRPHIDYVVDRCNKRLNLMRIMSGTRWGVSKNVLLIVYKALIRSIMDYGCIAYDTASLSVKSKLDSVQYKAMRICCGAMTGTPATSLQVECGQPPSQLMMADYSLKIKSIPNHSTATILEDSWQNHYGKFKRGRETFSIKVKQTLQSADIDYIPVLPRDTEPWRQMITKRDHLPSQKQRIRQLILDEWQEIYDYCETGEFYKELYPTVCYKPRQQLQRRGKEVQVTRLCV